MIIQMVKFETRLSAEEVSDVAQKRAPEFRKLPGLIQKYYVRGTRSNEYAGVYIWDSPESMKTYRESDLAASIPHAYKVLGPPQVETYEVAFTLRD